MCAVKKKEKKKSITLDGVHPQIDMRAGVPLESVKRAGQMVTTNYFGVDHQNQTPYSAASVICMGGKCHTMTTKTNMLMNSKCINEYIFYIIQWTPRYSKGLGTIPPVNYKSLPSKNA